MSHFNGTEYDIWAGFRRGGGRGHLDVHGLGQLAVLKISDRAVKYATFGGNCFMLLRSNVVFEIF